MRSCFTSHHITSSAFVYCYSFLIKAQIIKENKSCQKMKYKIKNSLFEMELYNDFFGTGNFPQKKHTSVLSRKKINNQTDFGGAVLFSVLCSK